MLVDGSGLPSASFKGTLMGLSRSPYLEDIELQDGDTIIKTIDGISRIEFMI